MENTIVGIDLAKDVIQVCVFTNKKVRSNTKMTPSDFTAFLANAKSLTGARPETLNPLKNIAIL